MKVSPPLCWHLWGECQPSYESLRAHPIQVLNWAYMRVQAGQVSPKDSVYAHPLRGDDGARRGGGARRLGNPRLDAGPGARVKLSPALPVVGAVKRFRLGKNGRSGGI